MKIIMQLITALAFSLTFSVADEVNRDSKESKERPHLLITARVEKIEQIEKKPNEADLMTARLTIQSVQRRNGLAAPGEGQTLLIYYKTGRPQRPRLPVLEEGKLYNLYLRTMAIGGNEKIFLEFEDDVTPLEEPRR